MPIKFLPSIATFLAALVLMTASPARADDQVIEPFVGHYKGQSISGITDETADRLFDVWIRNADNAAFEVEWTTTSTKTDGRIKEKSYRIAFKKTGRPGIFASAQRRDMFGNDVPFDPMKGDPYVWSRLVGPTLTVFAMSITEQGGYDMQVYERTLTDGGLAFVFMRHLDGIPMKSVTGHLQRMEE